MSKGAAMDYIAYYLVDGECRSIEYRSDHRNNSLANRKDASAAILRRDGRSVYDRAIMSITMPSKETTE